MYKKHIISHFQNSKKQKVMFIRLRFHFGAPYSCDNKMFSSRRYREILFHKVALCYLLHFVQDGCSQNVLGK